MYHLDAWKRQRLDSAQDEVSQKLLRTIWGFNSASDISIAKKASYFNHYWRLLFDQQLLEDDHSSLRESQNQSDCVVALINDFIKPHMDIPIKDVRVLIQSNPPDWLLEHGSIEILDKVLRFSIQVWLFVTPELDNEDVTLKESVHNALSKINAPSNAWLWQDFSANTLKNKAGFKFVWTNEVSEHLTFESRSVIRIFSKASAFERYEKSEMSLLYPPGFLMELRRTLNLLWPIEEPSMARCVRRLEDEWSIDIEASVARFEKFNLRTYPVFGDRLMKIQERLEHEARQRDSSTAIKVAIWGIFLTAIFGLISAITSTVQMWASLQALKALP